MTSLSDVALLRVVAQGLVGPGSATPAEAVRRLTALQAQDHPGALVSVALRTSSRSRAEVESALDAGELVKSWPVRGTLHLLAAEDLPWMLRLLAPRVLATTAARRAGLGLDDRQLDRAREVAVDALSGGRQLRRAEMFARWRDTGLDPAGQRGIHALHHLALTGTVVFGPTRGGEQLLVLVEEWVRRPRVLEREQALGELALRYFRSHGPATATDLTRWTKLVAADVRTAVALARPQLAALDVAGVEHLLDPRTPDRLAALRADAEGVLLLPGFDELLLGYTDRRAQLAPQFADRIVPGGNGIFRPTVVRAGRVVGTWTRTGRGASQTITATPFTTFAPEVGAAIPRLFAALP